MITVRPRRRHGNEFGRQGTATSVFAYDGDNLVEETNSSGTAVARYSQGLNIDEPLAMLRSSTTSFYHADGLGSVTSLSSSVGAIADTYTYDSFGSLTASTGSITNPFRYTARESDTETGLYYYRARYYDPQPGRFLSEDPLGFGQGVNFYAYVGNNPTNLIDPTGLAKCCPTKEQDNIQKQADDVPRRLDQLRDFGTAVLPTDTSKNIGGQTGCNSGSTAILPNGQRVPVPDQYNFEINVDPKKYPCQHECTVKHEMVHARQCALLGGIRFNALVAAGGASLEIPAYMVELGCFLKMQMDNQLGPYK